MSPDFTTWTRPDRLGELPEQWKQEMYAFLTQHPLPVPITQVQGYSASQLTGEIAANGSKVAGSGFTSAKISTAIYEITFSKPFTAIPKVVCSRIGTSNQIYGLTNRATDKVRVRWSLPGGTDADQDFEFVAFATR